MARLRFTAAAKDDLEDIAVYIAERSGSRVVAARFVRRLRRKCRELATAPIVIGRSRPDLRPELRSQTYRSYIILFRYVGDMLEIVDILEGYRDIDAFFNER